MCFTDGTVIGAVLDRNGLRPGRFWVTKDDFVVLGSEAGVLDIAPADIVRKGRLQPGKMFLVDTAAGRILDDDEIKADLAAQSPYAEWLDEGLTQLSDLPAREHITYSHQSVLRRQQVFGYTHEEMKLIVAPMAKAGAEPLGSMGTDTPIAVLSQRPRLLFDYFSQLFAQVTNPPLDAIREEVVTSVARRSGRRPTCCGRDRRAAASWCCPSRSSTTTSWPRSSTSTRTAAIRTSRRSSISGLYRVSGGGLALKRSLDAIRHEVSTAIDNGARIIVLSDRNSDELHAPIPSLLLTAAVHHHLVRERKRTKVGLVVECGDAREVHHMALLVGYGAGAINPYLAFECIEDLIADELYGIGGIDPNEAVQKYIKARGKGVLKVMSKMGVSTVASYTGAQIFEAIGLGNELVEEYFTGTVSRLGGIGLDEIAAEVAVRHAVAHPARPEERAHRRLELGGEYQWRREGEYHLFNPETVFKLQHATRAKRYDIFKQYTALVDDQSNRLATLRGLFKFKRRRHPDPDRRGRAGGVDPQAVQHRGDELRLDLRRSPRDACNRNEPDRRQVEHRRGRRRSGALRAHGQRRLEAVVDQAGGVRALRRDERVPRQLRRHPDQDRAGGEARRGRPAARPQGVPVDREDPALDARRRPDLAAAAPRHLLDRGSQAADPRPEERQPAGPRARQARRRGRGRHRRRRREQGQGRRRAHLRPRRRHGRQPAHVAEARRRAVGARPRRDPADAAAQRPARPHRRAGRRPAEDRSRRRDRGAARRRGVRLRDGAARRVAAA